MEKEPISIEQERASQAEPRFDDAEERYFLAMTNDCADPDDGTARTHEQIQEDWALLASQDGRSDTCR